MGKSKQIVALRLPAEMTEQLERLQASIDLPPSTVLRLLIASQLNRPFHEQIEVITSQIVKQQHRPEKTNRISLNSSKHGNQHG